MTSCGLNDGPLPGTGVYEARIACNLSGRDGIISTENARKEDKKKRYPFFTQTGEDREEKGDQYIANLRDGSWCGFKYFLFDGSEKKIRIKVKGHAAGIMKVYTDRHKSPCAKVPVKTLDDWGNLESAFSVAAGVINYKRFLIQSYERQPMAA